MSFGATTGPGNEDLAVIDNLDYKICFPPQYCGITLRVLSFVNDFYFYAKTDPDCHFFSKKNCENICSYSALILGDGAGNRSPPYCGHYLTATGMERNEVIHYRGTAPLFAHIRGYVGFALKYELELCQAQSTPSK